MNKIIKFFKKKAIQEHLQDWASILDDVSKPKIKYVINSSEKEAFSFRNGLVKTLGLENKSLNVVDSLLIDGNNFIFIEFINDFIDKKKELKLKALESPLELAKLLMKKKVIKSIYDLKSLNFHFVVVHKTLNIPSKEPTFLNKALPYKRLLSEIENNLKQYEGVLYKKTLVLTIEHFEELFVNKVKKTRINYSKISLILLAICATIFSIIFFMQNYSITFSV